MREIEKEKGRATQGRTKLENEERWTGMKKGSKRERAIEKQ